MRIVRADVLTENESMLKVFRRLGFSTHWVPGGTSEAVLKLKGMKEFIELPFRIILITQERGEYAIRRKKRTHRRFKR